MKKIIGLGVAMAAFSGAAFAGPSGVQVPEVGVTGSVVALVTVAAAGVMLWERKRNRRD